MLVANIEYVSFVRILGSSSPTKLEKNQILKMPIQIKYIDGGIGVEFIGSGVVTGTDIIAANKEIYRNENFPKHRYQYNSRTRQSCRKNKSQHYHCFYFNIPHAIWHVENVSAVCW